MSRALIARLLAVTVIVPILAADRSTAAATPDAPSWSERVGPALVDIETAWQVASGVLVGDGRTVVVTGLIDTGRALHVQRVAEPEATQVASARVAGEDWPALWILTVQDPLVAQGLTVAAKAPAVGDPVWLVSQATRRGGALTTTLGETRVTAVSGQRFAVAAADLGWRSGSPVLNAAGELLGLLTDDGHVVRVDPAADRPEPEERGTSVLPIIGLRLGGEAGGLLDGAFTYDLEAGVSLWDRLALVARFGLAVGEAGSRVEGLPATGDGGPGATVVGAALGLRGGVEARYRLYLGGADLPFYVDLAAGAQYMYAPSIAQGPAFYSGDPGCDPVVAACPLRVGPAPAVDSRDAFDASFGVDVRLGGVLLGYRLLPGLGDAPLTHQVTVGVSVF